MEIISIEEFQKNQEYYFDKVDNGDQIIIQLGEDKTYKVVPFDLEDIYFNPTMIERINKSLNQIKNGESKQISTKEEITNLLGL